MTPQEFRKALMFDRKRWEERKAELRKRLKEEYESSKPSWIPAWLSKKKS